MGMMQGIFSIKADRLGVLDLFSRHGPLCECGEALGPLIRNMCF